MSNNIQNYIGTSQDIDTIFSPLTIRKKATEIFELALNGKTNFTFHPEKYESLVDYVVNVTLNNYPTLNIPFHTRWNHFQVDKTDRIGELNYLLQEYKLREQVKAKLDLVVVSVLLDAGAGTVWHYKEQKSGKKYSRSEGLAIASFRLFLGGFFSNDPQNPYQVSADKLVSLTIADLSEAMQVSEHNVLVGLEGRLTLLQNLGKVLSQQKEIFGIKNARIGNILDYLEENFPSRTITATQVLRLLQNYFGGIWPGRLSINHINLGDVWHYSPMGHDINSLIPFHKLSQWLSYSLFEPLTEAGFNIIQLDALTGLPEYRNGGLLLDLGLIQLKNAENTKKFHLPNSELIIEWRALTVHLLDEIANKVAIKLGKKPTEFPLPRVLEGGTWWAGRKIATELRNNGSPPLKIESDGTVF